MRVLPRTCALVLGAVLALAWSYPAEAQRGRGKRGHSGSVSKKSDSKKKDDSSRKKTRSQPQTAPAPTHQPQRAPAARPPRAPAYQPPRAPAYQPQRAPAARPQRAPAARPTGQQPRTTAPVRQPARAPAYRPTTEPVQPLPATLADRARRSDNRLAVHRVPARVSRIPTVPPVVKRGGLTYTQFAAKSGGHIVVTRKSTPSASTNSPYPGDGHVGGAHDGHHGGHHSTTSVRHYHYHYWGYGYYYCYIHAWPYYPWFWGFYFAPLHSPWYGYPWWWADSPWYGYWGWYYTPYVTYVGPSYWVTDYTIARMLEAEYERGWADGQAAAAGTPISEPVKEQIRVQVDDVARAFQASEALLLEKALADPEYLFIVDTPLSVATDTGGTCALTGGDIIRRAPGPEPTLPVASMTVVTSKSEGCAAGSAVSVSYSDLQEMLNTFGQTVDDGLNELQQQQQEKATEEP